MVEVMHDIFLDYIKVAFVVAYFIVVFANEVTIIDIPNGYLSTCMWFNNGRPF
jgi:hypothetical protein